MTSKDLCDKMEQRNIDVLIKNLEELRKAMDEAKKSEDEVVSPYDENWNDLTWMIECHPVHKGEVCLNEEREIEYGAKGWEENCRECKLAWLGRVYE